LQEDALSAAEKDGRKVAGEEEDFPESRFGKAPGRSLASELDTVDSPDSLRRRIPASSPTSLESQAQFPAAAVRLKGVQEVAVIASDQGFFPNAVFVNRDVPVRMYVTGASKKTLCIMMDSFQVRRQVKAQQIEELTFTPNQPGKFRFYCPVNGMEGFLVVKELASVQEGSLN
jgi:plastocyanin